MSNKITLGRATTSSFADAIFEFTWLDWFLVSAFGILLIVFNAIGILDPLKNFVSAVTLPARTSVFERSQNLEKSWTALGNLERLVNANESLASKNLELESQLAKSEALFSENQRLLAQTGIRYERNLKAIGSQVIGYSNTESGIITINKGRVDGVDLSSSVVVEEIAVGEVVQVAEFSAQVRLINHNNTNLAVRTTDNNLGLLRSRNATELLVADVLQSRQVSVGEKIFTGGLNSNLPANMYLGTVQEIVSDPRAPTKQLIIDYPIDLRNLTRLIVLTPAI